MAAAREKPWGFPHFILSRNCAEKICRWGYYTPTPPRCSGTLITFCRAGCKANAGRLLKAAKFFAPLTTTGNSKLKHARSSPLLRALIVALFVTRGRLTPARRVRRAQTWDRVRVSRGMLLPLLPFGYSSPTREECSPPKMRDTLFVLFDKV